MKLVVYSQIGAELHHSGSFLLCEERGYTGMCQRTSRFLLVWTGRICRDRLEKRLCTDHALDVIKKARDDRKGESE